MSMKPPIDKRLVIKTIDGTVTERMFDYLSEADKRGRNQVLDLLRSFSIFGFMVQELGGGVIDALQSMERNGELEAMDTKQRAEVLINMLERVSGKPIEKPVSMAVSQPDPTPVEKMPPKKLNSLGSLTHQFKATSV